MNALAVLVDKGWTNQYLKSITYYVYYHYYTLISLYNMSHIILIGL